MQTIQQQRRRVEVHRESALRRQRRKDSRARRWRLFRFLRAMTSLERGGVRACQTPREAAVTVTRDQAGIAHVSGIRRCGSPWSCPVCAPVVRERRAAEIDAGLRRHLAAGGGAELVTVTTPHEMGMRLADVSAVVRKGWTSVIGGPAWIGRKSTTKRVAEFGVRDELGVVGIIKSVEVTYGANGWHPHIHALVLTRAPLGADERERLRGHVLDRWQLFMARKWSGVPSAKYGVDVRKVEENSAALSGYLTKVQGGWGAGLELARTDVKKGRNGSVSPWELLGQAVDDGDAAALELWHEYEQAMKGCRAVTWSPGLHALLGVDEVTDEQAAAEELEGEALDSVTVPRRVWLDLVDQDEVVDLLDGYERHGPEWAERFIRERWRD